MAQPAPLPHPFAAGAVTSNDGACRGEVEWAGGATTFRGSISLEFRAYGGDGVAVRSADGPCDLSPYAGLTVRARGDGRRYRLRLRTSETFAGVQYEAELAPPPGGFRDHQIPFAAFEPVFEWSPFAGHPLLDLSNVRTFGLTVVLDEAGPFLLELESIVGYAAAAVPGEVARDPRVGGAPSPDAAAWDGLAEKVLLPLALEAAGLPSATTPAAVFAGAGARRAAARTSCYQTAAEVMCEDLAALAAARTAARHVASARAASVREAIVYLAMEAAYERAIASDLVAETCEFGCLPRDLEREWQADQAFARWSALNDPIRAALDGAGLTVDQE